MADDWYYEEHDEGIRYGLRVTRPLFQHEGPLQRIDIFETAAFGRALAIDRIYMTSEGDEFFYHEMLVHPALVTAPSIRRVLIIGGGDGGTAREVLRHPEVEYVRMVEIDGAVVEACKKHLPSIGTAWTDPRLEVTIGDGIRYAAETKDAPYDVVLLDGSDPVGPATGLFNLEFYQSVRRILRPEGVFALQSESPIVMRDVFRETQKTLGQVYETVRPYFGPVPLYSSGVWSYTYASSSGDPLEIRLDRVKSVEDGCRYYNRDIHRAAFAQPNFVKRLVAG